MCSDERLYQNYLQGEEAAAEPLVEKYGDALVYYLNGYLKDPEEAEDLMIEAFSRMFAKERPLKGDGSFRAYLYKTARNLALRQKQGYWKRFLHLEELSFEPQSDAVTETIICHDERDRHLYRAMEALKTEYREAIYLVYFEHMQYREAAAIMGKSEQQITNLVYRGKQRLKLLLEQEGFVYADD